jgi:curved DNA-binding protein CbpA
MSGIDVFSLPLSPREGFVLSRVDGMSSVEDISIMVGVKQAELLQILDRLAELKVVKLPWVVAQSKPAERQSSDKHQPAAATTAAVQRVLQEPLADVYDPKELEVEADIDVATKRRILNAFYGHEGRNYYELLGVERDADKKLIRGAYFELSKLFHPDSLFGKELGAFKTKMEVVFKRLTEAYEVLGRNQRRKEYDEYLQTTEVTHAFQERLEHVVTAPAVTPVPVQASASFDTEPPPREAVMPASTGEARQHAKVDLRTPLTAEQRRQQARERLRRGLGPPTASVSMPVATRVNTMPPVSKSTPAERRDSAVKGLAQSLRRSAGSPSRVDPVVVHLKRAQEAERAGDLLTAASALQNALTLEPQRSEIQEEYARVSKAVTRNLAANYEKQARYEEKMGKWAAAASSWDRVAEGKPDDAHAARSAAEAMLKAGGDLHRAQRLAQRAVDIAPSDVTNVVVLGRVLLAAGLRLNARRELEKAVKLDPQNEMIRNLLREAR